MFGQGITPPRTAPACITNHRSHPDQLRQTDNSMEFLETLGKNEESVSFYYVFWGCHHRASSTNGGAECSADSQSNNP
jgi:hypothetical protein